MKRIILTVLLTLAFAGTALAAELPTADPAEFAGKTIGVVSGSMQEQWVGNCFPQSGVAYFSNLPDATFAVESGKTDALFFSDVPFRYTVGERKNLEIQLAGEENIPVAPIFGQNERGDRLRVQFNEYLAGIIADGSLKKMEAKWVDGPEEAREFDDPSEPPNINGKLSIITQSGAAPFDYEKNGKMYGCEIEVVREFCRKAGYQPEFVDANMDAAVMGVHTGKYDMGAAALMITEERAKSVNFGEPILYCRGALLVRKGEFAGIRPAAAEAGDSSGLPLAKLSEFDGKRIGVQAGTMEEAMVPKVLSEPQISYFNTITDGVVAIDQGRIDAFVTDDPMLRFAASQRDDMAVLSMGGEEILAAPVFQKTERGEKLRGQFNDFLKGYRESGKLEALRTKWLDGPEEVRVMDTSELPAENGEVTIATEVGYAPMEYLKDGVIMGLESELLREFCKAYGYRPVFADTAFDAIILGVSTGKFDIGASGLTITEERAKAVSFGDPFMESHSALMVKKDGGWTGAAGPAGSGSTEEEDPRSEEGDSFLQTVSDGFRRTFLEEDRWKLFVSGMWVTLLITVLSVVFGTAAGFSLYLLCRNGNKAANALVGASRWLITGMPLVVFLMVLFYVVFGKTGLTGTVVSVIGFTIVFGFTMFDLMKSGEAAVSIGQKEAAYALGYTDMDAFLRIILPQAAVHFLPAYQSEVVALVKATAVVGYITVMDVTKIGDIIRGRTYDAIYPLLAVVIAYFLLAAVLKVVLRQISRRVDTRKRPKSCIMKGVEIR